MLVYEGNQTAVRILFVVTPVFEDILTRKKYFLKINCKTALSILALAIAILFSIAYIWIHAFHFSVLVRS